MKRVAVLVDYWNAVLALRSRSELFKIDWARFTNQIASHFNRYDDFEKYSELASVTLYGSQASGDADQSEEIRHLQSQSIKTSGLFLEFNIRKKKYSRRSCSSCGTSINVEEEKGNDVKLCTDAIELALNGTVSDVVFYTNDSDFTPLFEYLRLKSVRVHQIRFPDDSIALGVSAWAGIDFFNFVNCFEEEEGARYIVYNSQSDNMELVESLVSHDRLNTPNIDLGKINLKPWDFVLLNWKCGINKSLKDEFLDAQNPHVGIERALLCKADQLRTPFFAKQRKLKPVRSIEELDAEIRQPWRF